METTAKHSEKVTPVYEPAYAYQAGLAHGIFSPFEPGTRILPKGYQVDPQFMPLPVDIVFDKDVAVTLRDGAVIYVDVFRPVGSEKVPVIIAWSPYGKSGGTAPKTTGLFNMLGLDNGMLSGLAKFEGPDPAYWCAQGYAVCNPDARGIANSDGDIAMIGTQEGRDCHDLIEWLAVQEWCNSKVAMSGTSYLAFSQWFTAAEQPPHLAAINPWEGLSDGYRDLTTRGGMPDLNFTKRLEVNHVGKGKREDVYAEAIRYPLANNDLWDDKIPKFDRITVPAYVVASYSNTLHTAGTFRAWRRMASTEKWLRIHNTQEWPDYYEEANKEELRRFFDHYLKGEDNGWEITPRVRYAVHDFEGGDLINQPAGEFPPVDVVSQTYYLNGRSRSLTTEAPAQEVPVVYDAEAEPGLASFTIRFDRETVLVGYPKAHLWVEAKGTDDMDLFILVQKLDVRGNHLQQFIVPNQGALMQDLTERGGSVLRYKGSNGRLRVSARHLDETLSTADVPAHSFDRVEKLQPDEIVDIEIDLFPIGMAFYPGEQLRLVVSSRNDLGAIMPGTPGYVPDNKGQHIIHTGGSHASYLQLPVKPV
ncbi:CocE/NonD family hydrolase [Fibrivirga algicola]|uniref:CocE/NonD family hydrolase n=1 Tax=Fibrivirga algicola TaxID=2950420 RepID=A0ABX0QDZ7_9BACT|nr:CocE/NonD family hydrolase [Fibrivirga algicola]NID09197.1 CocE/NonD family hydrolase [Fibrivirga algicola]